MIVTGLYLWWPRGRGFWQALRPRLSSGPRLLLRDLHATVAVLFAGFPVLPHQRAALDGFLGRRSVVTGAICS